MGGKLNINSVLFNNIFHIDKPCKAEWLMYNIYSILEEIHNDSEAQPEALSESVINDAFATKDIFEITKFKSLI